MSFPAYNLYPLANFGWSSNDSRVKHTVGFWRVIKDSGSQVVFLARNRSSPETAVPMRFLLDTIFLRKCNFEFTYKHFNVSSLVGSVF